ncbi:baeRF7 domain-containing protein [Desulfocastanea catecholica]
MTTIEKHDIESLLQHEGWPAISIYMPVSRIGDQQDPLRYKKIITEVTTRLLDEGMRPPEARSLLEPESALVNDADYWKHLGTDGLAVFLAGQTALRYPLPLSFAEQVMVGRRLHIRPLLPLLIGGPYLVLALSRKQLQLFRGDRYQLEEIALPEGTPKSIDDALQYDDPQRHLQFHTKTGTSRGQRDAMFHGHGMGFDDQNEDLVRYLQAIDRALFPRLDEEKVPIILAGPEELHAGYRNITKGRALLSRGIAGNVSELSPEMLHQKAWDIALEYFSEEERQAVGRYQDSLGGDKVVDELQSVVMAAFDGRVENLFVAENAQIWGQFDPDKRQVIIKKTGESGGSLVDLLDEAVYWTLQKKGTVFIRTRDAMPVDRVVCAQLRY